MSFKAYRGNRCLICGKQRDADVHYPSPKVTLLYKLLHLAWPRWGPKRGEHHFKTDQTFKNAAADADRLKRKMKRLARR